MKDLSFSHKQPAPSWATCETLAGFFVFSFVLFWAFSRPRAVLRLPVFSSVSVA